MADFIISPYAISFNSIKNALESYIENKSDVTTTWKDFYTAGAGQTILELDAAVAAFYAFHFIIGRREAFLTVAQNYNSVVGGALSLGYNCSRGHNVYVTLNIVPTTTQTLSKWTVIGSYAEYDVVLLEDTILNAGYATQINCVIGDIATQAISITSNNLQQFVFTASDVTDTCALYLNNQELPFSTELKDAMDDKYIMLTNSFGAVDVFYLNNGSYNYTASDILYLQYIQRNNLTFGGLSGSNLNLDFADQVESISLLEDRMDVEDIEHIRMSAPIYHETNNVVRARKDYVKYLKQNNSFIIDANDKDINPGLIALTYLKKQSTENETSLLTQEEKEEYIRSIMQICPDGVATAIIEDPVRVVRSLAITLWPKSDENIAATIEEDIDAILDTYRNKLAPVLDLEQIEHDIEQLPGVKIARVDLGSSEYELNKKYKLYDVVTVPDILVGTEYQTWTMYCGQVQAKTGQTEPDWASAPNNGDQIQDNNFIWENSNKYQNSIIAIWQPDGSYDLYSDINTSYVVEPNCTLQTEPIWGGQSKVDGNVTWNRLKNYNSVLNLRQNNQKYEVGQQVIVANEDNRAIYNVTGVLHKSGAQEPDWDMSIGIGNIMQDNALTWTLRYNNWRASYNYVYGDQVGTVVNNRLYVYTAITDGTTGIDNPFTEGPQEVKDGTVTWSLSATADTYTEWTANTEIPIGSYVNGNNRYYQVTDIDNTISGTDTVFLQEQSWLNSVTDNNVIFTLDIYQIDDESYNSSGTIWKPQSEFALGDKIIASSTSSTFLYQVSYTSDEQKTVENVIYSVIGYAGTTSATEPMWGPDNVEDNDILWTKTENPSNIEWEPETNKRHGDIITTSEGYYVFSSVLGTSGSTQPDWTGIKNNQVQDNNITWIRITNSNTMALQWNEYLDLKAESPIIVS